MKIVHYTKYSIYTLTVLLLPLVAFAANHDVGGLITRIGKWTSAAIPVLTGLALLAFIWGLVRFIYGLSTGDEKTVETGKKVMIWGIVALFFIIAVWGLVKFLESALIPGVSLTAPKAPCLNLPGAPCTPASP